MQSVITPLSSVFWIFCSCFFYETSRLQLIYSDFNVLVSLSKPKAVALVQYPSAFVLSVSCFSALSQQCRFGLTRPQYMQACCSTIHTIALHTTWQLLCMLQTIKHISCHHCLSPHPSGNHMRGWKCFSDDRLLGTQPFGTVALTLPDQWNYLISTFKDTDPLAVSVITADPC